MSLALTSSTSPMMDYERKEVGTFRDKNFLVNETGSLSSTVACHSLMQNKARNNFQVISLKFAIHFQNKKLPYFINETIIIASAIGNFTSSTVEGV